MSTDRPLAPLKRGLALTASSLLLISVPAAGHTHHALVLHFNDRMLSTNLAMDDGLGAALPGSVQVGAEFLGAPASSVARS
jgi:hypothetical protein